MAWIDENGPSQKPCEWRHTCGSIWLHIPSGTPWLIKVSTWSFTLDDLAAEAADAQGSK